MTVFLIQPHRLLIRACQYNFRTSAHTQRALVFVQRFGSKLLTLLQYKLIKVRQHGRVKTDGVFYQHNHLHTYFLNVMLQIHLVFYQLDDRHQQVGISQPTENILKDTQVFMLHAFADAMRKRSQHH